MAWLKDFLNTLKTLLEAMSEQAGKFEHLGKFHMAFMLRTSTKTAWLSHFLAAALPLGQRLAESIRFVSDAEMKASLGQKLIELLSETDDRIALFVEREQKHPGGKTQRLYKQKVKSPKKAYGAASGPVVPKYDYDPKAGSESIIAQFLSQFCKEHPKVLFHPPLKSVSRANKDALYW